MKRVYLSPPHLSGEERLLVDDAFASNWIAPLGPHVDAFEREFADAVGVPYAVALSSGTAALHLAIKLLGVQRGDEVLCSSLTFAATANALAYEGAEPVFVDCESSSWNIDPDLVADALGEAGRRGRLPKAVIAVDLYGQCADYRRLRAAVAPYGIPIIEDAAEALGAFYDGTPAGSFGDVGAFSFNGNKIITTSGGGMLVSRDRTIVEKARFLATQARDPAPHYEHSMIGYNYRMSNLLAAVGRGQLRVLRQRVDQRRGNFDCYSRGLRDLPGIQFMPELEKGRSTRWLTCILVDPTLFGATRDEIRLALEAEDIESRPVWKPLHLQPVFANCRVVGGEVSEHVFARGLCLPSGSNMLPDDLERTVATIRGCHGTSKARAGL